VRRLDRRWPWAVAGGLLLAAALLLFLSRPRPAPAPAALPAPPVLPLAYVRVAGGLEGGRAAPRSLFLLEDGTEIVLREGSAVSLERAGDEVRLSLEAGELYADTPERHAPLVVRTPAATVATSRGGLHVRASARGTSVTAAHGAATVTGRPFGLEITREETVDVTPEGAVGKPLRIDPQATLEWVREAQSAASLLSNGGFEDDFRHWEPGQYAETQVRIDRRAHLGRKSALVHFNAVRDYEHRTPAAGPLSLRPGRKYRLAGYVEYEHLEAGPGGGITLEVHDSRGPRFFRASTPAWSGSSGWRKFWVDFTPPEGTVEVSVLLVRARVDAPTQGKLRLDGLALYPAGT
jgi:hypothetical protein